MHPRDGKESVTVHDLSIIIVSWNVAEDVCACLQALDSTTQTSHETFVIDNASHDGTVERVRLLFPQTHVIANTTNAGFARACNQGIKQSSGAFVLLINPDCVVSAHACDALLAYARSHPAVGVVGPRLMRPDGANDLHNPRLLPTLWSDFCDRTGLADAFPHSRLVAAHHLPQWDRASCGPVEGLSGACMMLRRQALADICLLDEGFFLFGEDADLCLRLRKSGWDVHYVGTAPVVHSGGASTSQNRASAALYALQARQRFFLKHRGLSYARLHRVLNAGIAACKIAAMIVPACAILSYRKRSQTQWRLLQWCVQGRQA
jgi:N-acetylglucosaminyl-diphospho-decaprenol L-rhamnosyltransferase